MGGDADDEASAPEPSATKVDVPERRSKPKLANAPDFGPRYRVTGVLGKGGMGEVFRAFDSDLRTDVALKVVRADGSADSYARFFREISLARKVTSPHVLRVYDLAEHEGLRFLSMELVEGEDLAALLRREKRVDPQRALEMFRQVCLGLAAAHKQGVVHRDLKPHNVLVATDGTVRVADFGLARSIAESGVTASGAVLGSPAYMSPEQVKGDPVDERSDIYSLGIMLYQLLAGATPFQADTPHAVMEMRLHKAPRPLRELAPGVSPRLERIVQRCLAIVPDDRFKTIDEILAALDERTPVPPPRSRARLLAVGLSLAILAGGGAIWWAARRGGEPPASAAAPASSTAPASPARRSLAQEKRVIVVVTPGDNATGEPLFDQPGTVVGRALRNSRRVDPVDVDDLRDLESDLHADHALSPGELAREVMRRDQVAAVVIETSIARRANRYAISMVVKHPDGTPVFDDKAEVTTANEVVAAYGRLCTKVRQALGDDTSKSDPEWVGTTHNLEALREFSIGARLTRTGDYENGLVHLERATQLDPKFSDAWVTRGTAYWNSGRPTLAREMYANGLKHLDQVSERDRLRTLGDYYMLVTGEIDRAIATYRELVDHWVDHRTAGNLAMVYGMRGDFTRAVELQRPLCKARPRHLIGRANLANFELLAMHLDEAIDESARISVEFTKPLPTIYLYNALGHALRGDKTDDEAKALDKLVTLLPALGTVVRADFLAARGKLDQATAQLTTAIERGGPSADMTELAYAELAEVRLAAGDKKGALAAAAKVKADAYRRFRAALVELAAGAEQAAVARARQLESGTNVYTRAYAKLINARRLANHGKLDEALAALDESKVIADTWTQLLLRGQIALEAGRAADAVAAFEAARARAAEGALTPDDTSWLHTVTPLPYWLGRAFAATDPARARRELEAFIASRPDAEHDELLADAKRRLAALPAAP